MLPIPILRFIHRLHELTHPRDHQTVADDVDYALQNAHIHLDIARAAQIDLPRANILEIGPGLSFAPQLAFASHGACVTVADPFLKRWDPNYHPKFYRQFRAKWDGPAAAIDRVIKADGYPPDVIRCVMQPIERLWPLEGQQFDLVLSNAVLEHVSDLPSACRMLATLTRIGGVNSHQVDFRDHRNFERPLEFLLRSDAQFLFESTRCLGGQGNRVRYIECVQLFNDAGFSVAPDAANSFVENQYFTEFLPRLRASVSRYRDWPAADLRILSARFSLHRTR
jgi:Methyltransferase domain